MGTQYNSSTDRRRSPRIDSNLPVKYRNLKLTNPSLGSLTKDISEGGVSFKTNEFISLACRLVVEITIPTLQRPIKAISKVAWIKKNPSDDHYELGNQFLEISKEDRAVISDYVSRVSGTNIQSF
ncbi:MAG: PilZ domain-containing protein [Candidatus Omnitrophota bacterium]|jgi:c-di-GMP-binding flagellar brake protein YcgR